MPAAGSSEFVRPFIPTLDPSSKLYTESETDENVRTTADVDAAGRSKTFYSYFANGLPASESYPNGGMLSYGYDREGNVNAITSSTADGEANTNTTLYAAGEVARLISGNNTVDYTYDSKRRITGIRLNDVGDYVRYVYSGEHTNAGTVTATMADGTEITSVQNLFGNLTQSRCNDRSVTNTYSSDQRLTKTVDSISGTTTYGYDDIKNLISVTASDHTENFVYDDAENTLRRKTISGTGINQIYSILKAKANRNNCSNSMIRQSKRMRNTFR